MLESQKAQYADYLNALQDANGKNLWVLKADKGLTKKELSTMETAFTKPLDLIKSGNL
ncbi:hypothetical protein KBC03_01585 [Patescibacteria group bacterium]|nr:hypothetical protein [Patescibacteria group bacterium]